MDFGETIDRPATIALVLLVLAAPVLAVWLALRFIPGTDRRARIDAISGFGCGMIAAGSAAMLGRMVYEFAALDDFRWLTVYVPVAEETLKAAAIAAAIGVAAILRAERLSLRRCAVATISVVIAFAASENLYHLSALLLADPFPGESAVILERLRVRAILPPLGHVAESWLVGAAIWTASRWRGSIRSAVLLAGLAAAMAVHALWNASALWWWPNPWPLLSIVTLSITGAIGFCRFAVWRQDREGGGPAASPAPRAVTRAAPRHPAGRR